MANTVNQPDGASASPLNPPAPAAAASAIGPWTVRYEVDWAAEGVHDFTDGLDHTVGGVRWNMNDGDNALVAAITSNGLELSCKAASASDWANGAYTAPRIAAGLDDGVNPMFAAASLYQAFCFQAIITSSADVSSGDFYGTCITKNNVLNWATSLREYDSAIWTGSPYKGHRMSAWNGIPPVPYGSESTATSTQHTFYELTFLPSGTVLASSSTAATLQDPMSQTAFQAFFATNTSVTVDPDGSNWDKDELYFLFLAGNVGAAGGGVTHTMTHFRLLTAGE